MLAAFAQVQSLTEALNEYINVPLRNDLITLPATSLCDDCHRTRKVQLQNMTNNSDSNSTATVTTMVRNNVTGSNTDEPPSEQTSVIQDDDGYCEIDEIRMPSVYRVMKKSSKKTPKKKSSKAEPVVDDTETNARNDDNENSSVTDDGTESIAASTTNTTTNTNNATGHDGDDNQQPIGTSDNNNEEHLTTATVAIDVNEPSSTIAPDATATDDTNANAFGSNLVETKDDVHIEINDAYDTFSQRNSDVATNADADALSRIECASDTCPQKNSVLPSMPLIPCHLITTYVSALNQHISLLLVRINYYYTLYSTSLL